MKKLYLLAVFILFILSSNSFAGDCNEFPDKLLRCEKYECYDDNLFNEGPSNTRILGEEDGKCHYVEYGEKDTVTDCKVPFSLKLAIVQFIKDVRDETYLENGEDKNIYFVDGKEVRNPYVEAFKNGSCTLGPSK